MDQFNYPKDIFKDRGNTLRDRPKPSPSKTEQFMKDLGLDYDDDITSDTSSEGSSILNHDGPSQIEFRVLQKELSLSTKECDMLKERNRELQASLNRLNSRLKKEETSKNIRLKILQRAYNDSMKDKLNLINNLQELLEDGGNHENSHLVSSVKELHDDKAKLYQELLKAEENHEKKIVELEERYSGVGHPVVDPVSIQALEKITEEKVKLSIEIENIKKQHADEIASYEDLLKEKESELIRSDQEKEKKSRSHNSVKLKLETLRKEFELDRKSSHEKEKELETLARKQKETIDKLEKENQLVLKQMATLESDMTSRLNSQSELSQSSVKLQEENRTLLKDLDRYRIQISDLQGKVSDIEPLRSKADNLQGENENLQAELFKAKADLEKQKVASKEKLRFAEHEVEEARLSLQQQKRVAASEINDMKLQMEKKEELLKREIDEIGEAYRGDKSSAEKSIQKLEEKLSKAKTKEKNFEMEISDLKKELQSKSAAIADLQRDFDSTSREKAAMTSLAEEREKEVRAERKRGDQLSSDLQRMEVEKDSLERQISALSGKSDSKIAEMERESRDLRIELAALKERHRVSERERTEAEEKNKGLENKVSGLNAEIQAESDRHKVELESTAESHKREVMKLKATSAIATESLTSRASALESAVRLAMSTLRDVSRDRASLRREVEKFPGLLKDAIKRAAKQVSDAVADISEANKELVRRYKKEMTLRKKYHNELVELRGNIRVFVRARPLISEDGKNAKIALSYDVSDDAIINVNNPQKGRTQTFEVDRVFRGTSTQEEVYAEVQALVTSCMDGYHVCIFAYGQTGSGKTYTMEGTSDNPGINQRALNDLFRLIDDRSSDWDYIVNVSLVEIYNETLRDLLNSKSEKLEIKMNADGSLFVQRLKQIQVKDIHDVNKLFKLGHSNRATASTNMNERSSRSHAVLMITVEGKNITTQTSTTGRLNLIDLAGSERVSKSGASGDRLKEAQNINRSLSALGDVIHALRNKQGHVPFRNSKLTYLLQDSLSKESKTLMVVQVSPIEASLGESVCSLNFAQRVRAVELGQATKKVRSHPT